MYVAIVGQNSLFIEIVLRDLRDADFLRYVLATEDARN